MEKKDKPDASDRHGLLRAKSKFLMKFISPESMV